MKFKNVKVGRQEIRSDIYEELTKDLSEQLAKDIDREILNSVMQIGEVESKVDYILKELGK